MTSTKRTTKLEMEDLQRKLGNFLEINYRVMVSQEELTNFQI